MGDDGCGSCIVFCCCTCCLLVLYVIFVSVCTSLYVKTPPDYDLTQPIVAGDYVKIVYEGKDYDSFINRSLTISVNDNYSTIPLELYQSACDDLNTREQFTQSIISITNCSRKCGIDSFLYFINSDQSVLSYNFTVENGFSEAKLVLFDDYYMFYSYLTGSDIDKSSVLQEFNLIMPGDNFVAFDLTKLTTPSYYFVAFQSSDNKSNTSMNFVRQMTQVLWDNSSLSKVCTSCDQFVYSKTNLLAKQCFFLYISRFNTSTDVLPVHVHGGYSSTAIWLSIYLGGILVSVCCCWYTIIAVLLVLFPTMMCCYNEDKPKRSLSYTDLRSGVESDQSLDRPDVPMEDFANVTGSDTVSPTIALDNYNGEEDAVDCVVHDDTTDRGSSSCYSLSTQTSSLASFSFEETRDIDVTYPITPDKIFLNQSSTCQESSYQTSGWVDQGIEDHDVLSSTFTSNFPPRTLSKTRKSESKSYITEQKSPEFGRKAIQHKSHKLSQSLTDILTAVFNASEDQLKRFQESLICNDTLTTEITFDGQYETIPFDNKGLFYHSHEYGVTIVIPEGAVQVKTTLQFGATTLLKRFECQVPSFIPVSPFIWVHTEQVLSKPAELYIPHHALVDTVIDRTKLHLLTKGHNQTDVFRVNNQIETNIEENFAHLSASHFCLLCLMSEPVPKKRYHLVYAKLELDNNIHHVDVCVLYSFKCLKTFKDSHKDWVISQKLVPFRFGKFKINIELPNSCGWNHGFRDVQLDCITEDDLDFYKVLDTTPETVSDDDKEALAFYEEEGQYPPCFKLMFIPKPAAQSKTCQINISLFATANGRSVILPIDLQGETTGSPTSILSSIDSGIQSPASSSELDLINNTADSLVVELMSLLDSKLTTDYVKFGHHLGLTIRELYRIEETVGHDTKRCVKQILFHWRNHSKDITHEAIVKALQASGYQLLSKIVESRFSSLSFCSMCQMNHGGGNIDELDSLNHILCSEHFTSPLFQQEPTFKDLSNFIVTDIPDKWELFGIQLHIEQSTINALRRNNLGDCERCFLSLLGEWKRKRSSPYNWSTVIKALYSPSLKEYKLAESICNFIQQNSSTSTS